jgi:hypothetical protein
LRGAILTVITWPTTTRRGRCKSPTSWTQIRGWPLNCDVLPLNIKGASRFLRKWPLATLDIEPPEALWPETKGQAASLARIRGHPLHGAGGHQADSRGQPGKGVPSGLTATVTATAATSGKHQRPATAHNSRTICANWGYVRPEKRKVVRQRRPTENLAYALRTRVPEMSPNRRQ